MAESSCNLSREQIRANYEVLAKRMRTKTEMVAARLAAEHQVKCPACAVGYINHFTHGQTRIFSTAVGPEAAIGPVQAPTDDFVAYKRGLLERIQAHRQAGGKGIMGVLYRPTQRATALLLLQWLGSQLKKADVPAMIYRPDTTLGDAPVVLVPNHSLPFYVDGLDLGKRIWVAAVPANRWDDVATLAKSAKLPVLEDAKPIPESPTFASFWEKNFAAPLRAALEQAGAEGGFRNLLEWTMVPGLAGLPFRAAQLPQQWRTPAAEDSWSAVETLVEMGLLVECQSWDGEPGPVYQFPEEALAAESFLPQRQERQLELLESWRTSLDVASGWDGTRLYRMARHMAHGRFRPIARLWLRQVLPCWAEESREAAEQAAGILGLTRPRDIRAWAALLDEFRFPLALALAEYGLAQEPVNPYLLHCAGQLHARRALIADAHAVPDESHYEKAKNYLGRLGESEVAQHSRIYLEVQRGQYERAAELFGGARNRRPPTPYWTSLWALIEAGRGHDSAQRELRQWAGSSPDDPYAWMTLAMFWDNLGERQRAKEAVAKVLALQPHHLEAMTLHARLLREHGEWNAARASVEETILPAHPDSEYALQLAADLYAEAGNWAVADLYYRLLFDVDPGNLAGIISRCDWLLKRPPAGLAKAIEEVEGFLDRVDATLQQSPYVKSIRGRVLAAKRDPSAISFFRGLFDECMKRSTLRNQLALAYARLGDFDRAKILLGDRLTNVVSRNTLARVLRLRAAARPQQALEFLHEARRIYSANLEADPDNRYTCRAYAGLLDELANAEPSLADGFRREAEVKRGTVREAGLPVEEPPDLWSDR